MNLDGIKILFVEDDPDIRSIMKDYLEEFVEQLYIAKDGLQGLNIFNEEKPDIVISDINMPNMNGIEMAQQIKQASRNTVIILITAFNETSYLKDAIDIGIDKYLTKPVDISKLMNLLNDLVNEIKKDQELLQKTSLLQQYKDTVDRSAIVSKTNPKGVITYVNNQFCEISGFTYDELIGKNHNIVRHRDMDPKIFKELWNTIKIEKKPWVGEIKNRTKEGGYYWVHTIINPIFDNSGEVIEYIAIRRDITNEVKTREYFNQKLDRTTTQFQDALKLSKEYEKAINVSTIVSRTDHDGIITYVNDKFCEVSGYKKSEVIGENHNIVRHKDTPESVFKELWDSIQNGKVWSGILKNRKKDGKAYWVNTTIVPIIDINDTVIEYMAIRQDVSSLFELHKEVEETQREIIYKMGEIGETRSKETGNHVKRVAHYSKELAKLYGLSKEECETLFIASPMHDIGKVGIPDFVLNKTGKLNDEEWKVMKTHSIIGKRILQGSKRAVLQAASIVAYEHHEKYDGSGYPRGIEAEDIHIYGRITALADVFDALGSDRCYKNAWEDERIFTLLKEERGKHFDPKLIDLFFDNLDIFLDIRDRFKDDYEQ